MQKLVEISGLSVRHGNLTALEDVNLDIYADDFIGVIGPNGGGKSTLVKSIVGLQEYEGNITLAPGIGRPELSLTTPLTCFLPSCWTMAEASVAMTEPPEMIPKVTANNRCDIRFLISTNLYC